MPIKHHPWASDDDGTPEMRVAKWFGAAPRSVESPAPPWRPPKRKKVWEPHDDETRRMIRLYNDMYRLQHSEKVVPLLEDWKWRDKMETAAEKQRYLEPLLGRVRKAPEKNQGEFVFLLLVFEGVRRGVERLLLDVRSGLDGPSEAVGFANSIGVQIRAARSSNPKRSPVGCADPITAAGGRPSRSPYRRAPFIRVEESRA